MKTIYYRHNDSRKETPEIPTQKIAFCELTFVLKGELTYFVNDKKVKLVEGDCVFIRNGESRKRLVSQKCDYVSFNFLDDEDFSLPTHYAKSIDNEIKLLINLCDDFVNKYLDWTDKINHVLSLIINLLLDNLKTREENLVVLKIKRFISNNLNEKLTLLEICDAVCYSQSYCDTLFKKQTGYSIIDYLINARIEKAKLLIAENILSLKEIAEETGFEDYNYFARTFKKRTKFTPKNYQKTITDVLFK